ncbi:45 kDa calcium-binding protein [Cimex lectularius]|uniref:EF-hand domain-containing protein n=1 Tax=Cimex lectularius TaxID=79782 RepID=A0A8I6S8B9_CIMLE|nr:45 kDa calcium-binding protein [Cimex lectularius]
MRLLSELRLSVLAPALFYLLLLLLALRSSVPLRPKKLDLDTILERMRKKKFEVKEAIVEYQEVNRTLPPVQLLTVIFKRADRDNNSRLTVKELSDYIHHRTKTHIEQATKENYGLFMSIDKSPRNGVVTWEEYHAYFLEKNGLDKDYIKMHTEKHQGLGRSLKEAIARDKASWYEAAKSDPDFLTLDEFLTFRHPESSHTTILAIVDDLLDKLDRDGDELLTEEEFAMLQVSGSETVVSQGEAQRREEFRNIIDIDKNSVADRKELIKYIDPKNPRHAREEAETLMTLGDTDKDGQLSLDEVLSKMDLFLGSKMVNTARSFHDEF